VIETTLGMSDKKAWKNFVTVFMGLAILFTGLGFMAGNEIGAANGLSDLTGLPVAATGLIIGLIAIATVVCGTPKLLEMICQFFVVAMGVLFIITMFLSKPNWGAVAKGVVPSLPEGSLVNCMGLIGTTIIAINLVYHSMGCQGKYKGDEGYDDSKFDTRFNVILGVLMTLAIIITSGTVLYGTGTQITNPVVFSQSLEPVLGSAARIIGDLGLFLAGLSSSIATPFMAGMIIARLLHWEKKDNARKILTCFLIVFGTILAMMGKTPTQIIIVTQALSGFFLPFIAIFFVISGNNKKMLGKHTNSMLQNILGGIACAVTLAMGCNMLWNNVIMKLIG
ncbi:MAG: divalent metal cation transporter, partial [Tyzzerella sp.]|nr:divalent metal cation transporter [Tyzzerella sp.]